MIDHIERMFRRSLHWFTLFIIIAAVAAGIFMAFMDKDLLVVYDRMALWNLLAMITFLALMLNPSFRNGMVDGAPLKDFVGMCIAFAVMSLFTCLSVESSDNPLFLNFGFMVPMMAGFAGGFRLGVIVSVISAGMQLLFFGVSDLTFASMAIMLLSGATSSLWPKNRSREPGNITLYPVPIIIGVIATAITFLALYDDMSFADMWDDLLLHVTAPVIIAGILSTIGYELIIQYVSFKTDAMRSKNDLAVAHNIQASAVPKQYPESDTVTFGSLMESAVEVGGDFYDVFKIKEGLIGMVMADVSGKGLPAALFMMRAQATLRANAMVGIPPNEVLRRCNIELCQRNDVGQFVTVWIGMIDTDTGMLTYSNAGHTPPYIITSDSVERMECPKGMLMGYSKKAKYSSNTIQLRDGDTIFLYTDGVNEAFDDQQEQYGQDRLLSVLEGTHGMTPQTIVDRVREDVSSFVGDAPMSDDITMLCFTSDTKGQQHMTTTSDRSLISGVIDDIHEYLTRNGCPENLALKMDIVTEELFVNICNYSYKDGVGPVDIYYILRDDAIRLTFVDTGIPFDPTGRDEVVLGDDISQWPIGGLGIHMSLKLTDSAHYKRILGRNIFTVVKHIVR